MAPQAKRFPGLPSQIFGIKCVQHRVYKMSTVLKYYKKQFHPRATKYQLLRLFVKLEAEITDAEGAAIRQWLPEYSTYDGVEHLMSQLNNVRGILPKLDCCVCMDSLDAELFPQQKITPLCNHEPTVCRSCLTKTIDTQIPEVAWDQVQCPECSETLPYDVVKEWASLEAFDRYDQKSLLAAFRDMPNFTMCLGPRCDSGQIHETEDAQPIMTCTTCHFKTCFTHKMPWHSGQTCAEYDAYRQERMDQEAASEKLIASTTKKCPNPRCGHGIEKSGGCDHMICKQCRYQFCYVCLAAWKVIMREGNTAHAQECKYHSDRLNAGPPPVIAIPDENEEEAEDESDDSDEEGDGDSDDDSDSSEAESVEELVEPRWDRRARPWRM